MRLFLILLIAGCAPVEDDLGELFQAAMQCPTQTLEGVDVYQGSGTIDWAMVKGSGRAFAMMKASQGDYNKQSTFNANWANTKTNGLVRGAYHYFDATVDGVAQANWFLQQVDAAGGLLPGDLPAVLDIECPVSTTQANAGNMCLGNGKNGWAPTMTVIQRAQDFLDTVEAATGRKPILYSYSSWFATFGFTDPKWADYPLWVASISNTCATVPAPWTQTTFWQYSFSAKVPGIGGGTANVDADRFIGDDAALQAFTIQPSPMPDLGPQTLPDLAESPDLAELPDLATKMQTSGNVDGGCGCQVGGRAGWNGLFVLLLLALGISVRARAARR